MRYHPYIFHTSYLGYKTRIIEPAEITPLPT